MKTLIGSLIVVSLAAIQSIGCALPTNDDAGKASSAQNGNDPNGVPPSNDPPGVPNSPPDDDTNNEEGPTGQTCQSSSVVPEGWSLYDGGAFTVAVPPGAKNEIASASSTSWTAAEVGTLEVHVRDDIATIDDAKAFNEKFFANGKNGPRPCQVAYQTTTLDCHDALTMNGACFYGSPTRIDWVNVIEGGHLYFLACGDQLGKGDDVCAKFFGSFHVK